MRTKLKKKALFYLLLPAVILLSPLPAKGLDASLLWGKNRFAPHFMFLTPRMDSPLLLPKKSFALSAAIDYASIHIDRRSGNWKALVDMEAAVIEISAEYGAFDFLTVSAHVPFVHMSHGFMDGFLENYHEAFNFPDYGRSDRPKNDFAYAIEKDGNVLFNAPEGGLRPADSEISIKFPITGIQKTGFFSSSFSYTLKLPTGDSEKGLGSGNFDSGFSILTMTEFKKFKLFFNPEYIFLSDPDFRVPGVKASNIIGVNLGLSYDFNTDWSFLCALNAYSSPFKNTGIDELDDNSFELSFGAVRHLSRNVSLAFFFSEDIAGTGAPDFNVRAGIMKVF